MADFDITVLHPDYQGYSEAWAMMRDAVEGEDKIKGEGETYLPMKSGIKAMTDKNKQKAAYDNYKVRAEFPEIVSPTVQGAVGLIHSKPTEIELPTGLEYLREKATKDELTLDGLNQRLTTEVMRVGRYGLMPGVDESGIFHIASYTAETIRNWDAPAGALTYLVLDESGNVRDVETNEWKTDNRYRECYLTETGIFASREWIKQKNEKGKDAWVPQEEQLSTIKGRKPLDFVPFVFVGSTDLTPTPDDIPLYGLSKLAIRAYRLDADYVNALHMTSEPTPWVSGVDKESAPKSIGAHSLWVLPGDNSKAGMLEFSGQGVTAQEKAIQNTLERAIMFGAQLFSDSRKTAESGEAKKIRLGSQQASLKSVAITSASGLEKCLRNIAIWSGEDPNKVVVKPNLDFVDHSLDPQEILALVSAWQAGAYSKQTLFENFQRGEVINADRTFEDEQELIEADPSLAGLGVSQGAE